jgi:hypothetical protein
LLLIDIRMNTFFKNNWKHFLVIGIMFVITFLYFNLQFQGYGLKQHDIEQFGGASHEIQDYRERTGKETLWTNSMFGGMPSTQISVLYEGNYIKSVINGFIKLLPPPAGIALLYMLGFYVLMLCLKINPWIGLLGSIAFGFSSYEIIIIQAGHNTKALAVALMAPVVGAFIMAFQRNLKWGVVLSAIFMVFELSVNHLQVTYYLGILLLFIGLVLFVDAIRTKKMIAFFKTTAGLLIAYILALIVNYGNISMTNDYAKHTIRGKNDITINPDGSSTSKNATSGLDKDYITQWSYGIGESFTLVSPYVKGGGSVPLAESPFVDDVDNMDLTASERKSVMNLPVYWGEQPITSGPVYIGVIVLFLSVLGMVFLKNPVKWALLAVSIITLALSWGKNFMGLTDFFLDNIPGYNKFRAVTIILVMVELCVPIIGVLFLDMLAKEREQLKDKKKLFLITSGVVFVFLFAVKVIGLGDNYSTESDARQMDGIEQNMHAQISNMDPNQLKSQFNVDISNPNEVNQFVDAQITPYKEGFEAMKKVRASIFDSSMNRSILFFILSAIVLALFFYTAIQTEFVLIGLVVLVCLDLIPVASNYLGNKEQGNGYKYWTEKGNTMYPMVASSADNKILEAELNQNPKLVRQITKAEQEGKRKALDLELTGAAKRNVVDSYKFSALNRNTNYRVFDMNGGFSSANSSYFHKALGGYHGAKLRNIQNIFDFQLTASNYKVFDMLNVKYFIRGEGEIQRNSNALGNAWFVKSIKTFATPNDEIRALGSVFEVTNSSKEGSLIVNGKKVNSSSIFSSDKVQFVLKGDTIPVPSSAGITEGVVAVFVMDINGKTNLVPIQTLENDTQNSFLRLVTIKNVSEFDPKNNAILLKSEFSKVGKRIFTGEGKINMLTYEPNKITYAAEVKGDQFVVFSEIYYPEGWTLTVDGKETPIVKTNYLLRGAKIPNGKHTLVLSFDLPAYHSAGMMASIASILILLALGAAFYTDRKQKN